MLGIDWRESMTVGVKEIDDQHKQLINTIEELNEKIIQHAAENDLSDIFEQLSKYIHIHLQRRKHILINSIIRTLKRTKRRIYFSRIASPRCAKIRTEACMLCLWSWSPFWSSGWWDMSWSWIKGTSSVSMRMD